MRKPGNYPTLLQLIHRGRRVAAAGGSALAVLSAGCEADPADAIPDLSGVADIVEPGDGVAPFELAGAPDVPAPQELAGRADLPPPDPGPPDVYPLDLPGADVPPPPTDLAGVTDVGFAVDAPLVEVPPPARR